MRVRGKRHATTSEVDGAGIGNMNTWDIFYGPNAGYALDLYERYRQNPDSVDAATRAFFDSAPPPPDIAALLDGAVAGMPAVPATPAAAATSVKPSAPVKPSPPQAPAAWSDVMKIVLAARLARSIREYGHLNAHIDPLGTPPPGDPMLDPTTHDLTDLDLAALPATIVWPNAGPEAGTCLDAIHQLQAIYSGTLGYDFDHVEDFTERTWLMEAADTGRYRQPLPREERRDLLRRLTQVESFEHFLHTTFQGQKRFSIEGTDVLVPMLDELIHDAAQAGTREVLLGMAHRGRLNVLAHILGKPYQAIFSEFHSAPNKELVPSEGSRGINYGWTGDVKYHLGAKKVVREGDLVQVQLTMAHNASHLEFVNPVVEGFTRAAQDDRRLPGAPVQNPDRALCVTIHGDAAFPGEGVVAETLNLSRLRGYSTGGTIHIIANNQLGFTTEPGEDRSTLYASDLAKGFEIPVIHVNADDPEACLSAIWLAHAYRDTFHKDFLIEVVGYRRWGHNEGDEPSFTQPRLYEAIGKHPTVRALYAQRLAAEAVVTEDEVNAWQREEQAKLKRAYDEMLSGNAGSEEDAALETAPALTTYETAVPEGILRDLNAALLARPEGFAPHSRLERLIQRRRERIEAQGGIEWAHAEALAFASILANGTAIRLSGQDTERGTFSQRHLVLHDTRTGDSYVPLQALLQARASFAVYNSPLSEAAVLGFEYGYSVHAPDALVLWEAQFGDFANAGQVLFDQFIAAARAKWRQLPSLVLLLPHGYEGQGPEHSSGRVERYLQLAAEDNLRVANCTTAAQYFHLLRVQAATLGTAPRPLVVMTPKSLLRHPLAGSSLADLAQGRFQPVLDDTEAAARRDRVERLVLCSGKVWVDLAANARTQGGEPEWIAISRVELLYPFPEHEIEQVLAAYPNLREVVWLQEEPQNMGAWSYIAPRLQPLLPAGVPLSYIGRPERAATAEGMADMHTVEQGRIVEAAFAGERTLKEEAREEQHVG